MPRRVNFVRHTEVFFVPSHSELTDAERRDAWYSAEERSVRLGADIRECVRLMRRTTTGKKGSSKASSKQQAAGETDELCIRGLEHMRSSAHLEQRRINRDCVVQAVMEAQEKQKAEGRPFCPIEVSIASSSNSEWARNIAKTFGESDALYVKEYVRSTVERMMREQKKLRRQAELQMQVEKLQRQLQLQQASSRQQEEEEGGEEGTDERAAKAACTASRQSHRRRTGRRSSALMKALEIVHNSHSDAAEASCSSSSSSSTKKKPLSSSTPGRATPARTTFLGGDRLGAPSSQSTSAVPSIAGSNPCPSPLAQQINFAVDGEGTSAELLGHLSRMRAIAMRNGTSRPTPSSSSRGKNRNTIKRYSDRDNSPSAEATTKVEGNPQQA